VFRTIVLNLALALVTLACSEKDDGAAMGSSGGGSAGASGVTGSGSATGGGGDAGASGASGGTGAAGASSGGAGSGGATGVTCAEAGGNRCADAASKCSGLVALASSDCAACCKVPSNPVFDSGWADPFIVREGDTYYTFATGGTVRRRSSKNLADWSAADDALGSAPWKKASFGFWAPAVYRAKSGKWILYYASERKGSTTQKCIGRAVANNVTGQFVDNDAQPFLCRPTHWSIDPSVFSDKDGKDWLLWRQDTSEMSAGNAFIRPLDANGNLAGQEHLLISRAKTEPSWEFDGSGGVLENPAMIHEDGVYHLFYSGFRWETAKYANGHAICDSPIGPCNKTSKTDPWQGSLGKMLGPGGLDFVKAPDGTLLTYMHGWVAPDVDVPNGRKLWLYRMKVNGKTAALEPL
jgi:GH43 family beta-xylosidase